MLLGGIGGILATAATFVTVFSHFFSIPLKFVDKALFHMLSSVFTNNLICGTSKSTFTHKNIADYGRKHFEEGAMS